MHLKAALWMMGQQTWMLTRVCTYLLLRTGLHDCWRLWNEFKTGRGQKIIKLVESGIDAPLDEHVKAALLQGPDEITLVRSGLEDTMREAYQEIKEMHDSNPKIQDRRTASFASAIRKIANIYDSMYL